MFRPVVALVEFPPFIFSHWSSLFAHGKQAQASVSTSFTLGCDARLTLMSKILEALRSFYFCLHASGFMSRKLLPTPIPSLRYSGDRRLVRLSGTCSLCRARRSCVFRNACFTFQYSVFLHTECSDALTSLTIMSLVLFRHSLTVLWARESVITVRTFANQRYQRNC